MSVRFCSLASGSSGNCYYIGTENYGILIDAGIGSRTIKKRLLEYGVSLEDILAVFITHDHSDHIKSVGYLGERMHIPIYATKGVHTGINNNCRVGDRLYHSARFLEKRQPFILRDFEIECFDVPHDGTDNVGYCIGIGNKVFCFVTDLGHITPLAHTYISKANYLIIEANYDERMLAQGVYPWYLKERIAGPNGHMCNADTAEYLATHYTPKLKYVWLCHLSKENNMPTLAYSVVEERLRQEGLIVGRDLELVVLERNNPSPLYRFE